MLLAGDIGGTKTLLGIFGPEAPRPALLEVRSYPSQSFDSFVDILDAFTSDTAHRLSPSAAAFGVAGPVVGGRAQLTNVSWNIDAEAIARRLSTPRVALLNDLEATAIRTGNGFIEIKTEPIGLQEAPSPSPSASPAASASPGASASPAASPSPGPSASAEPSPSAAPVGTTDLPDDGKLGEMVAALEAELGPIESQASLTTIGPVVSADLINQALVLILVGSLGIMAWITYRFRDWKFGTVALVTLLHDVLIVVGAFAILGTVAHVEVDALFVTAMLTVIGFSVHDTIVVFDRIRENKARHLGEPFDDIVNHSILQTIGRTPAVRLASSRRPAWRSTPSSKRSTPWAR